MMSGRFRLVCLLLMSGSGCVQGNILSRNPRQTEVPTTPKAEATPQSVQPKKCVCDRFTRFDPTRKKYVGNCQTTYKGQIWCYIKKTTKCTDSKSSTTVDDFNWSVEACKRPVPTSTPTPESTHRPETYIKVNWGYNNMKQEETEIIATDLQDLIAKAKLNGAVAITHHPDQKYFGELGYTAIISSIEGVAAPPDESWPLYVRSDLVKQSWLDPLQSAAGETISLKVLSDSNETMSWKEECSQPCTGPQCGPLAEKMKFLVDFSVDPCQDFFAFACNSKTRGANLPVANIETVDFKDLVKFPPKGFEYVQKFYLSCTKIDTGYTTEEVFAKCFEDGECDAEELQNYGDIFAQFLGYSRHFINRTMLPAVTPDWEEVTRDMFEGQGWNWWDFAALELKDYFFLSAFQRFEIISFSEAHDIFRSNIFFTPMTDTLTEYGSPDVYPTLHIVPISIHDSLRNGDEAYLRKYKNLMKTLFTFFGGDPATIDEDIEKIVKMELKVGEINTKKWFTSGSNETDAEYDDYEYSSNATTCADEDSPSYYEDYDDYDKYEINYSKNYFKETITIEELYELVPSVEWKDYIEGAFSHNPEFKIKKGHKLKIPSIDLMREMGDWVATLSTRDQANLLIWRMFITFANDFMHTGVEEGDLQENLFNQFSDSNSRSDNCIAQIKTFFPHAHDDIFIAKYVDESTKNGIIEMFEGLVTEFAQMIEETNWTSRRTKIRAMEKLTAMKIIVGDMSPKTLEFKELKEKISSEDYIANILAISNYNWDTISKNINKEKKLTVFPADTINAYYSPIHNEIEILAGIINELVVSKGLSRGVPRALVYGGFASILGHEVLHGFDNEGKKYDKDGFRLNWWKKSEEKTYMEKTQCLIDQYANFTILDKGMEYQIPCDAYPPGENIADNGGVKAAYRSYLKLPDDQKRCMSDPDLPFTSDQLFWLGQAFSECTSDYEEYSELLKTKPDSEGHYPGPWRVNTVLANQPEFAAAFKCPIGSHLNPSPQDRCSVW